MSKTSGAKRAAGSRPWRIVAIAAGIVLVVCLAAVLVWFFADPLHLPDTLLQVLDQRASVAGMFTGMALGAAALMVSVVALRAQLRAERVPEPAAPSTTPPAVLASGDGAVAPGGDHRRAYGGDHIEFHHNTFPGKVVGKQVNSPQPASPDGSDDAAH